MDGTKRLSPAQLVALEGRMRELTLRTIEHYGMDEASLWEFLRELLELARSYRRGEHEKLARLVERAVRQVTAIHWWAFGMDETDVHQKLIWWYRSDFESAWPHLGRIERAHSTFAHFGERLREQLTRFGVELPKKDMRAVADFAVVGELWEFVDGVAGLTWSDADHDGDWLPAFRYRRARAAASGLEFFIRHLMAEKAPDLLEGQDASTLGPILTRVGQLAGVEKIRVRRLLREDDWVQTFSDLWHSQPHDWAAFVQQQLCLALLARNLTTHQAMRRWDEITHRRMVGVLAEAVVSTAFIAWLLLDGNNPASEDGPSV